MVTIKKLPAKGNFQKVTVKMLLSKGYYQKVTKKSINVILIFFLFLSVLFLDIVPVPDPVPFLVPVLGPGPVIFLVWALVPVLVKISGHVTQWPFFCLFDRIFSQGHLFVRVTRNCPRAICLFYFDYRCVLRSE